jgi:hypothetical protein
MAGMIQKAGGRAGCCDDPAMGREPPHGSRDMRQIERDMLYGEG